MIISKKLLWYILISKFHFTIAESRKAESEKQTENPLKILLHLQSIDFHLGYETITVDFVMKIPT